jgi:GntR family transcriptional repressor for pyruvate dehydrogenase complex
MPFQKIESEKLSSAVVRQIELLILRGILRPGERLPSERELSDRLGVSRPSLREAVAELQDRGLLATRAGAGIYVAEVLGASFSEALVKLFATHDEAVFDYLDFRRDLEGLAAERAARLGSDTDLKIVDTIFSKMEAAHTKRNPADEAGLDAEFHLAIVEASHNVVMLHMMRSMFQLLREGVFYNRSVMF